MINDSVCGYVDVDEKEKRKESENKKGIQCRQHKSDKDRGCTCLGVIEEAVQRTVRFVWTEQNLLHLSKRTSAAAVGWLITVMLSNQRLAN